MDKNTKLCWEILPKVSRSFALAIKALPQPLADQLNISYLIYRVIDTIEDSHAPLKLKKKLFDEFISSLEGRKVDLQKTGRISKRLLEEIDYSYEECLLGNIPALARAYYLQPKKVRDSILKWGRVMAAGMYEFQHKGIETFADQDKYSYYVAGVVGYLFNDLLYHNRIITLSTKKRLSVYAKKFGLALQKVNILRDISQDIPSRRYYWPRRVLQKHNLDYDTILKYENRQKAMKVLNEEIENALDYLYSGMHYILSLPAGELKVRMFCLIPLFMAIESYAKCINNSDVFDVQKRVKISRKRVFGIVAKCSLWGTSNQKLAGWFVETISKADPGLAKREQAGLLSRAKE